jgi:putative membrane protein
MESFMYRSTAILFFIACLATAPCFAQGAQAPSEQQKRSLSQGDKQFLDQVAQDNQAEVALSLLAEKRAQAPAVKAFARLMANDHVALESQLAAVINNENVEVPVGIGSEAQQAMSRLETLRGTNFDREFMKSQIEDHSRDVARFMRQHATIQNDRIRQFAGEAIPVLQQHLALAQAVAQALGLAQPSTTGAGSPRTNR